MKQSFRKFISFVIIAVLLLGVVGSTGLQEAAAGAGDYSIKFSAADPLNYLPPIPYPIMFSTVPTERANGEDFIPGSWYTNPDNLTKASIESLNPRRMALCQIVPFEFLITVGPGAVPAEPSITFTAGWNIDTTNNDAFGYDPDLGVLAAFVDTGDGSYSDFNGDARVTHTWSVPALPGDEIQGVFTVTGLDPGDKVVVEAWLVLQCSLPAKVGGNVQSRLISAATSSGVVITTGNQTVPLLQVGDLISGDVNLSITKEDGDYLGLPDHPVTPYLSFGDSYWYEVVVTNNYVVTVANQVVVTDTLDPNLTPDTTCDDPATTAVEICANFEPDYGQICTWNSSTNTITCELGAVAYGDPHRITFPVVIGPQGSVPTAGIVEIADSCTQGNIMYDICNVVSVTTVSDDVDLTNNNASEPKDIGAPTAVDLLYFEGSGAKNAVILKWATASELDTIGFNLYRRGRLDGTMRPINAYLVQAQVPGAVEGASYIFKVDNLKAGKFYYFWLEDVDMYGNTTLHGPIYVKAKRNDPIY